MSWAAADDKLIFITIHWGSKALCTNKLHNVRDDDSFHNILFEHLPDGRELGKFAVMYT